jgi:hypothetical protein
MNKVDVAVLVAVISLSRIAGAEYIEYHPGQAVKDGQAKCAQEQEQHKAWQTQSAIVGAIAGAVSGSPTTGNAVQQKLQEQNPIRSPGDCLKQETTTTHHNDLPINKY